MLNCRRVVFSLCLVLLAAACSAQARPIWEYKILRVDAKMSSPDYFSISPSETELNALGKDGWELVGTGLEPGTVFRKVNPTTGVIDHGRDAIDPLVHPQSLILIFKRQIIVNRLLPSHTTIGK